MLVVDTSVALAWMLPDEHSDLASLALREVEANGAVVPLLFRLEVANALAVAVRRERISRDFMMDALSALEELAMETDRQGEEEIWKSVPARALETGLSVYDAVYLDLAMRRKLTLASFDRKLCLAAVSVGVSVFGP